MARRREFEIDAAMQEEIDFCVKYGYPAETEMLIRRAMHNRFNNEDSKENRSVLMAYIGRCERKYRPYLNGRCPECGVKLAVRRCLACDLSKG